MGQNAATKKIPSFNSTLSCMLQAGRWSWGTKCLELQEGISASRGTLRERTLMWTSWSPTRSITWSCPCVCPSPSINTDEGCTDWEQSCWEGPAGAGEWVSNAPLQPRELKKHDQLVERGDSALYSAVVRPYLECSVQLWGFQYRRDMDLLELVRGGHEDGQRDGTYLLWRQAVRAGVHLGEEQVLGGSYDSLSVQKGDL